jgi:hypothetical protein
VDALGVPGHPKKKIPAGWRKVKLAMLASTLIERPSRSKLFRANPPVYLLVEHFFNLANFLLNFSAEFFILPFGYQVGIVGNVSRFLLCGTLQFMKLALHLILCAHFHKFSPLFDQDFC